MTERLDEMIDQAYALVERKRELDAESKEIGKKIEAIQEELLQRYDEIGTTISRGQRATATIAEIVVPVVEDWGAVHEYIMENDALYLLHRRLSSGPWRELLDTGDAVPGVKPYTKRSISLRKRGD